MGKIGKKRESCKTSEQREAGSGSGKWTRTRRPHISFKKSEDDGDVVQKESWILNSLSKKYIELN